jgi:hypothetical protein
LTCGPHDSRLSQRATGFDPPLMPEIFNPNPVVFSATKAPRRTELSPHSLWVDDDGQDELESDDSVEPIDQDEIFGKITPPRSNLT